MKSIKSHVVLALAMAQIKRYILNYADILLTHQLRLGDFLDSSELPSLTRWLLDILQNPK